MISELLFSISYKQRLHVCEMINDGHQCVLTLHHRAMSMNTVISTGHNRGTEPSNAGGHGLGEDKVAIKTDWGAVQPRKIERKKDKKKKKQDMRETWVRGIFQTQCSHFIRKLCHSPISFCLTHTKPPRHTLHPLHQTEREKCPHLNVKLMFRDKTTWFLNLLTLPGIAFLWTRCSKQKTFCSEQSKKKSHSSSNGLWALKKDNSAKNENCVIIYLPLYVVSNSCAVIFFCGTHNCLF